VTGEGRVPYAIPIGGASTAGAFAYVAAADELLTDAELRDRMGRAARDRASVFDWATSARLFSEALGIDQRLP